MCCIQDIALPRNSAPSVAMVEPVRIESSIVCLKRVRKVAFDKAEVVATISPASSMSDSDRSELWYRQKDLNQFKNQARELCRQIRDCDLVPEQLLLDTRLDIALAPQNDCARGLEHRISMERQKNKFLAMRAIIKAQQRYNSAEQLAIVAAKCTAWSKEVALFTGCQDFYQAYNPALLHLVPTTPTVKFPLLSRKRATGDAVASSDEELPMLKKQRTMSPVPVRAATTIKAPVILLR